AKLSLAVIVCCHAAFYGFSVTLPGLQPPPKHPPSKPIAPTVGHHGLAPLSERCLAGHRSEARVCTARPRKSKEKRNRKHTQSVSGCRMVSTSTLRTVNSSSTSPGPGKVSSRSNREVHNHGR